MSSLKDLASLIMIPSLVKDGRLDTVKPLGNEIIHPDATGNNDGTDGSTPSEGNFTFSRGSNLAATRVDVNGLIEKGRENLVLHSNNFSNGVWAKVRSSVTSGATDPFGGSNAWAFLTDTTANNQHYFAQTISQSGVGTLSIYAKANGYNWLRLRLPSEEAYFDLANGVTGSSTTGVSASMTDAGNGWYRCEIAISNMSTNPNVFIHIAEGDGDIIIGGTPSGSDGLYIYAAQLEQGLVATDYIETGASTAQSGILEDLPRLDYSGGASCPSLLLEPQRTNALNHSEYFDNWPKFGGASVTNNATTSPEGIQNASLLSSGTSTALYNPSGAGSASQAYTASIYVKKISYTTFRMGMTDDTLEEFSWYFNLDTLATSAAGTPSVWTNTSAYAEDAGNGWIRCVVTGTKGAAGVARMIVKGETTFAPDFYIYGAQLEVGSYPTSYIPTYGSAVTRSADDCAVNYTNISDTSGTIFWQGFVDIGADSHAIALSNSANAGGSNRILLYRSTSDNKVWLYIQSAGVSVKNISLQVPTDSNDKYAVSWATNDFAVYINGAQIYTSSSGAIPTSMQYIQLNEWSSIHAETNVTKQALYFPTRLTNAELAALTA